MIGPMNVLGHRARLIRVFLSEWRRYGIPTQTTGTSDEVIFLLGGVGGTQYGPTMIRRALRLCDYAGSTVLFKWQGGLWGESFTDLMWLRRNRWISVRLARRLLAWRRDHPQARIHVIGFSGGAGISVFAMEMLKGRPVVDTAVLLGAALAPTYNLVEALAAVSRCYSLISEIDSVMLGRGTRWLGTIDRQHCNAAGQCGFSCPDGLSDQQTAQYEKLRHIAWTPDLLSLGHYGGHTGWMATPFLVTHLLPILRGDPQLPVLETSCDRLKPPADQPTRAP